MLTSWGLVQHSLKTGKRGFRKLGEDKTESPWRGLEDRRTDRMASREAMTKDSNKHSGPSGEAQSCIDCTKKQRRPNNNRAQGKSV